jgi:hypothetical protein
MKLNFLNSLCCFRGIFTGKHPTTQPKSNTEFRQYFWNAQILTLLSPCSMKPFMMTVKSTLCTQYVPISEDPAYNPIYSLIALGVSRINQNHCFLFYSIMHHKSFSLFDANLHNDDDT